MKHGKRLIGALLAGAVVAGTSWSAMASQAAAPQVKSALEVVEPLRDPVGLLDTDERTVRSKSGKLYRIFTALPTEQAPPGGWPVVYVLDGNAWFPLFVPQSRLMARRPDKGGVVPAVIVGIGYPGERPFNTERRTWDFTPKVPQRAPVPAPGGRPWSATGGADEFLGFIQNELKPLIESEYKIDRSRQVLWGHSLGGLFSLHALFAQPDSFQYFVAASPSVWWNERYIMEEAKIFAASLAKQRTDRGLLIAFGARELPEMVADPKALYEQIKPLRERGLRLEMKEIAEEEHVSVAPVAFNRLMNFALAATEQDKGFYAKLYAPAKDTGKAEVPAVPNAKQYLALSAEQRYQLRTRVRALPKVQRDAFNARFYDTLHGDMPADARQRLHTERIAMDKRHGTVPSDD